MSIKVYYQEIEDCKDCEWYSESMENSDAGYCLYLDLAVNNSKEPPCNGIL